ncbi:CCA tRNA nucleotidyltransferase [Candidatus Woesearchaeota archaeon]|nr:CCA tRNA nucleotidyltransferase [Candidatus Woesearchaeota archaeon]
MKEVLSHIKPNKQELSQFKKTSTAFLKTLNSKLKDAKAILGGSGAKGTWLSGNFDIDIFVLFDYKKYSQKTDELSNVLEPILKKAFPSTTLNRLHGSRDYFQMKYQNLSFEIVPILKISKADQAINITDVSPLHSQWVNKHSAKVKDDIMLTKKFCKANDLYGAESYINGFSGYVLEILVTYYGSLLKLFKASQKWKIKEVIDAAKYYPKKDALFHLNQSKLNSPLIVIDPVDKNRNAAAALSIEKLSLFQQKAKEYLLKPSASFFEKKVFDPSKIKAAAVVAITIEPLKGKEDVVGTKLLKVFQFLQKELEPFSIKESHWEWEEEAVLYFALNKKELPTIEIRSGPPIKLTEHVKVFKQRHSDNYMENSRIFARVKVPHPKVEDFVKNSLQDKYVKKRIKTVKTVKII